MRPVVPPHARQPRAGQHAAQSVLGPLDDAVMAALVLRHLLNKAGPEVVRDHWRGDPATIERLLSASGLGRGLSAG